MSVRRERKRDLVLANAIKRFRMSTGRTARAVAKEVGMPESVLHKVESGWRTPTVEGLRLLLTVQGASDDLRRQLEQVILYPGRHE